MGRDGDYGAVEDGDLAVLAGAGDKAAFEALARRWWERLRRLAAAGSAFDPEAAEEVAQDALVRIYEALPSFRGDSAFGTFAYRICRNAACDAKRRLYRERRRRVALPVRGGDDEEAAEAEYADPGRGPEEEALRADSLLGLRRAMGGLDPEDRALIHLYEAEGLDIAELSVVFEVATGTIKSRLYRVRAKLGKALEEEGYGPL